jgi:hypothetical protein
VRTTPPQHWLETREPRKPAVLVIVWLALVCVGIAAGFLMRTGTARKAVLGLSSGLAVACLLAQAYALSFPLSLDIAKEVKAEKENRQVDLFEDPEAPELPLRTVLGAGYWLALFGSFAALVTGTKPESRTQSSDAEFTYGVPTRAGESEGRRTGIQYDCPECGRGLHARQEAAGLTIQCTGCKSMITVPH